MIFTGCLKTNGSDTIACSGNGVTGLTVTTVTDCTLGLGITTGFGGVTTSGTVIVGSFKTIVSSASKSICTSTIGRDL